MFGQNNFDIVKVANDRVSLYDARGTMLAEFEEGDVRGAREAYNRVSAAYVGEASERISKARFLAFLYVFKGNGLEFSQEELASQGKSLDNLVLKVALLVEKDSSDGAV